MVAANDVNGNGAPSSTSTSTSTSTETTGRGERLRRRMGPHALRACLLVASADIVRLAAALPTGLGDAEALYAAYARRPQGGYLDHPPLIGLLDRLVLAAWPSAFALRLMAVLLFTLSAVLLFRLARALFDDRAAFWSVAILCVAPVFHVGGLAAAPDAPLAPLWFAWLLVARRAWLAVGRSPPLALAAALGGLLGAAFLAKYSALALVPAGLAIAWRLGPRRGAPAAALAAVVAAVVALPVIAWNVEHGFASVAHRLVWSQPDLWPSPRNLGALVGGQLLYLSPLVAIGLGWAAVRAWRERAEPAVGFCLACALPPLAVLAAVCLWSRVAEPHWPAPAYYALLPLAGRMVADGAEGVRRFARAAGVVALAMNAAVYAAVLTPALPALVPAGLYVAKYDITNELYGWEEVAAAVRRRVPQDGVVVAGHYTMCAQLDWNLRGSGPAVDCRTAEPTDFDLWRPAAGPVFERPVLFVSDERFPDRPPGVGGGPAPVPVEQVTIERGGVPVRRFLLTAYPPGAVSTKAPR